MINLNTDLILVPTDFSLTSAKAIKHAAFLAQLNKGEIILLHVQKKKEISGLFPALPQLRNLASSRKEARQKLDMLAVQIRTQYNIPVHCELTNGKVISGIVSTAQKHNAGLIVMGTDGSESLSSLFLGSNSSRLLSKTSIPVMTVRADQNKFGYRRILLPIGSAEHSRQKVNYALQLAKLFHSHVYVLGLLGENEEGFRYKLEVIVDQVRRRAEKMNLLCETMIVKTPDPASKTLNIARLQEIELIVSMTDEDNRLFNVMDGDYDQRLVGEAKVPVLSVPPEIAEESLDSISIAGY